VDPNSGSLTPLADTQLIGMAAGLAALIRGQNVIANAQALRAVAAEQLDVGQFAFDQVIAVLAEMEFVQGSGGPAGRSPGSRRTCRTTRICIPGSARCGGTGSP
jgi:hypothetical protein